MFVQITVNSVRHYESTTRLPNGLNPSDMDMYIHFMTSHLIAVVFINSKLTGFKATAC